MIIAIVEVQVLFAAPQKEPGFVPGFFFAVSWRHMTAPNHAVTGALIGLTINPWLALPLAFLSHFVCDAIPHYDPAETDTNRRLSSRRFFLEFIVFGAALCFLLVLFLSIVRPQHWQVAAMCAFLATSADLFWLPRYLQVKRSGRAAPITNPFLRFHSAIQWNTGPQWLWLELVWFAVVGGTVTYISL